MFIDSIQSDYDIFYEDGADYLNWQRGAYLETKAAEEAKRKSGGKALGLAAITGGIALWLQPTLTRLREV